MTIDERLERLVDRHEALAMTVELLTEDIKQLAAENRKFASENRQLAGVSRLMAEENTQRDRRLGEIMEGIARLLHVAEIHGAASPG